jgi:hypothetical protein
VSELEKRHQWEVHAAYRLGWEIRVSYYERMLRSIVVMLEDAQNLMKIDDMHEVISILGRAVVQLEDAWAMIALTKAEELSRREEQCLLDGSDHDPAGIS